MLSEPVPPPESEAFRRLSRQKTVISLAFTAAIMVVYYGFIGLIAFNREVLAVQVGSGMTLGLVLGIGVILSAWLLTGLYVYWANTRYDRMVDQVRRELEE